MFADDERHSSHTPSRRAFLSQAAVAGIALGVAPGTMSAALRRLEGSHAAADLNQPDVSTPDGALRELAAGNRRFVSGKLTAPHRDAQRRQATAGKQNPFAAVLSCADSRVPVEIIFDKGIGDLFPVRVAGNVATPELIASLEYGTAVLGCKAILVLGHSDCGAVAATMKGEAVPGQISVLYQRIAPAVDVANGSLPAAIEANVRNQEHLLTRSPLLADLAKGGKLKVVGGVYDLAAGTVKMLSGAA